MNTPMRWAPVVLVAALAAACQVSRLLNPSGGGGDPPPDTIPARVAFATQPKTATVGLPITPPVSIVVTDSAGNPVPNYSGSVTLALGSNPTGATLSGANTATAVNGVAVFSSLSVDKAGSGYTLTAASSGLGGATSAPFDVTTRPAPPPTHLVFTGQPATTQAGAAIAPAVRVTVEDSAGSVSPTYSGTVTIAVGSNPGGATLSGTRSVAASGGVATFGNLVLDQAGTGYALVATASGLAGATSASFDVTAIPPPPPMATSLKFMAQPQSAQAGASIGTITVAAVDSTGATVTDFGGTVTVTIGTNSGGGTLSGALSAATSGGVATFSGLSIDKAGTGYTLTATTLGLKSATSAGFDITAPPPPPPTNQPPVVNAGGSQSQLVAVLYQLNASFTDPDGNGDGPWTYAINWGDGTSSSGTLSAQGAIGPTHVFALTGSYQVTVTVTDSHGASGTDSKTLTVTL